MNDPLKRRVRRLVIQSIKEKKDKNKMSISGINQICSQDNSLPLRLIWTGITAIFLGLCVYQIAERCIYYWSEPISVDTEIQENDTMTFPYFSLCSEHSAEVCKALSDLPTKDRAGYAIPVFVLHSELSMQQIWELVNTTYAIKSAYIKTDQSITVERREFMTSHGTCVEFHTNKTMKYDTSNEFIVHVEFVEGVTAFANDKITISEHPYPDYTRYNAVSLSRLQKRIGFSVQRFEYLDRRSSPCSQRESFQECYRNCMNSKMMAQNICRVPFANPEVNLAPCPKNGMNLLNKYLMAQKVFRGTDPIGECKCPKLCHQSHFHLSADTEKQLLNETIFILYFRNNVVTTVKERYIYTLISLLCDMGGMLGLYVGMSLLTACEAFFMAAVYITKKRSSKMLTNTDPLHNKVRKLLLDEEKPRRRLILPLPGKIVMLLFASLYFAFLLWFIVMRTQLFLSAPTENTISVIHRTHVKYPSFILCQTTFFIQSFMAKLATRRSMTKWCDLELLDLMDLGLNVHRIWLFSAFGPNLVSFGKHFNQTESTYDMPDGRCHRIESTEALYSETFLRYDLYILSLLSDMCHRESVKVYIVNPGQTPDLAYYRIAPGRKGSEIRLQLKVVDVSAVVPSCDNKAAAVCKKKCVEERMISTLTCRLPFFPQRIAVPFCNSTEKAKKANAIYNEAVFSTNAIGACDCPQPCQTEIYETEVVTEPVPTTMPMTVVVFYFTFSSLKSISARFSYDALLFSCEISSFLGLFLGLSLLSLCEWFQSVIVLGWKRLKKKEGRGK